MMAAAALLSSTSVYAATEKFDYNSEKQVVEGKFQTSDNIVMLVIYTTAGYFDNGEKAKFLQHVDKFFYVFPHRNRPAVAHSIKYLHCVQIIFGEGNNFRIIIAVTVSNATCQNFSLVWNFFCRLPR